MKHIVTNKKFAINSIMGKIDSVFSTLYRSLLLLSFVFVKPIRSTIDPTYTSRIIVHGFCLDFTLFFRTLHVFGELRTQVVELFNFIKL